MEDKTFPTTDETALRDSPPLPLPGSPPLHWLLWIVLSVMIFLFAVTLFYIWHEQSYNLDEAFVERMLHKANSFSAFNKRFPGAGLCSRWIFYQLDYLFNAGISGRKLFATLQILATAVYVLFLSRRYHFFNGYALILPVLFLIINQPLIAFGNWGFYIYASSILTSCAVMHILFILACNPPLSFRFRLGMALLLGFFVFHVINFILVIAVLLGLFTLWRLSEKPISFRKALCSLSLSGQLSFFVLVAAVIGFVVFPNPELNDPRDSIWKWYFTRSDFPQTALGAVSYICSRTGTMLRSTLVPYLGDPIQVLRSEITVPEWSIPLVILSLLFLIGAIRSLCLLRSCRQFLSLYVLLCLAAFCVLSLLGLYPYGHVRYLLTLLTPILYLVALGANDVCRVGALVMHRSFTALHAQRWISHAHAMVLLGVFTLIAVYQVHGILKLKGQADLYNRTWQAELQAIDGDTTSAFVWDYYSSCFLDAARPSFSRKDTFLFSRAFVRGKEEPGPTLEKWKAFLGQNDHIMVLTVKPFETFKEFHALVARDFVITPFVSVKQWHLTRWDRKGASKQP